MLFYHPTMFHVYCFHVFRPELMTAIFSCYSHLRSNSRKMKELPPAESLPPGTGAYNGTPSCEFNFSNEIHWLLRYIQDWVIIVEWGKEENQ